MLRRDIDHLNTASFLDAIKQRYIHVSAVCQLFSTTMFRIKQCAAAHTVFSSAYRHLSCFLLLWLGASLIQVNAGSHHVPAGATNPAVNYHNFCSVCHGDKGDGKSRAQNSLNPPPRDFTTPQAAQISRAEMIAAVTNGRPGTAMTPWKNQLSPKEIEALVDYVRNTFIPAASNSDNSPGRIVYSKNCAVCHGEKGDGRSRAQGSLNPPPRDFTAPNAMAELSHQRMVTSVTVGRADTAMAGFGTQLSKEEINAVVKYIRDGFMRTASSDGISGIRNGRAPLTSKEAKAAAAPLKADPPVQAFKADMSAPMPHGLKGDLNQGAKFFFGNCATCHGVNGDGRGPRAYFINPKPRDFLHPASRQEFNRVKLFKMISEGERGSEMPAWNKVLTPQEIANVAEYVFQQFIIQSSASNAKAAKAGK
jgi:mono/diheme cytochrome c family protein